MPAIAEDIIGAKEEGVNFEFLSSPTMLKIEGDKVVGMTCIRMELGEAYQPVKELPLILPAKMKMRHYPPLERNSISERDPEERLGDFDEYLIPYSREALMFNGGNNTLHELWFLF